MEIFIYALKSKLGTKSINGYTFIEVVSQAYFSFSFFYHLYYILLKTTCHYGIVCQKKFYNLYSNQNTENCFPILCICDLKQCERICKSWRSPVQEIMYSRPFDWIQKRECIPWLKTCTDADSSVTRFIKMLSFKEYEDEESWLKYIHVLGMSFLLSKK